ncbi:MAG: electron transfer flavoprotein subunit alpha/FixB family protein [Vulcanimicrobiaceae bacterium]
MQNVLVYVEHKKGQTRKVTFELATQARELADKLGGKAHALVLGAGAKALAEQLAAYPLDAVHYSEDADVDAYLAEPTIAYAHAAIAAIGPSLVLVPNTMQGRDIGSRLAARLRAGYAADVTGFAVDGGAVVVTMPKMGGATISQAQFKSADHGIAAVRPNAFGAAKGGSGAALLELAKASGTYRIKVESEVEEASGELGLEEAATVVAGGRGLGGPEAFTGILKDLADAFGGAVGASRAAADAGWVPYSLQIGQTGKTVSPNLYIGVAISGAIQHKVGMRSSGTIVAINKDGQAPIADFCDLLVVGDAFAIVPELTKLVRAAKA